MLPFPKLREHEVAVALVEAQTGIPLNLHGQRHRAAGGEVYRVFASMGEARAFAGRAVAEDPTVDCALFDHTGRMIEEVRSGPAETRTPAGCLRSG